MTRLRTAIAVGLLLCVAAPAQAIDYRRQIKRLQNLRDGTRKAWSLLSEPAQAPDLRRQINKLQNLRTRTRTLQKLREELQELRNEAQELRKEAGKPSRESPPVEGPLARIYHALQIRLCKDAEYLHNFMVTIVGLQEAHRMRAEPEVLARLALTTLLSPGLRPERRERAQRLIVGPMQRLVRRLTPPKMRHKSRAWEARHGKEAKQKGFRDVTTLVTMTAEAVLLAIDPIGGSRMSIEQLLEKLAREGSDPNKPVLSSTRTVFKRPQNYLAEKQHGFLTRLLRGELLVPHKNVDPFDLAEDTSPSEEDGAWDFRREAASSRVVAQRRLGAPGSAPP